MFTGIKYCKGGTDTHNVSTVGGCRWIITGMSSILCNVGGVAFNIGAFRALTALMEDALRTIVCIYTDVYALWIGWEQ